MPLVPRAYSGPGDQLAMASLVHGQPDDHLHVVDLPYRFNSWAFDEPRNVALWDDAEGRLAAWAVLQTPFWALDYAYRPDLGLPALDTLLDWADGRARAAAGTRYGRPAWYANVFAGLVEQRRALERAGFASQAEVGEDSWSKVLLRQTGAATPTAPGLPAGFQVRPLGGEAEVAAYVDLHRAVFESTNMTVEWRARTLRHPAYRPELDLVIAAPEGRLAAFCVGWLLSGTAAAPSGQIEPMGVHADFRRLGLGHAILIETVRRLVAAGAAKVFVETDNYRNAAFQLYESVGFRVVQDVLVYRKDYVASA